MYQSKNEVRTVAIIPARGGSKGLPGKNLMEIGGVPLVGRTVLAAKNAVTVDQVYVTTDCTKIAAAAEAYGAEIITRPASISGDRASSETALLHALGEISIDNKKISALVFLQCTSPFTKPADVDNALNPILAGQADATLTVAHNHKFLWQIGNDGFVKGVNHNEREPRARRQDINNEFVETGAVYAMNAKLFKLTESRFCGRIQAIITDAPNVEIDSIDDLRLARLMDKR